MVYTCGSHMKVTPGNMALDGCELSASLHNWLGHELELRGIDAIVYTRYILSILQQDPFDGDLGEAQFFPPSRKHLGGKLAPTVVKAGKTKKWSAASLGDLVDERRKSAAIECLLSVTDEDSGIENLVDELYHKLKEQNSSEPEGSCDVCADQHSSDSVISTSSDDPTERYYAAFPALSDKQKDGAQPTTAMESTWSKLAKTFPASAKSSLDPTKSSREAPSHEKHVQSKKDPGKKSPRDHLGKENRSPRSRLSPNGPKSRGKSADLIQGRALFYGSPHSHHRLLRAGSQERAPYRKSPKLYRERSWPDFEHFSQAEYDQFIQPLPHFIVPKFSGSMPYYGEMIFTERSPTKISLQEIFGTEHVSQIEPCKTLVVDGQLVRLCVTSVNSENLNTNPKLSLQEAPMEELVALKLQQEFEQASSLKNSPRDAKKEEDSLKSEDLGPKDLKNDSLSESISLGLCDLWESLDDKDVPDCSLGEPEKSVNQEEILGVVGEQVADGKGEDRTWYTEPFEEILTPSQPVSIMSPNPRYLFKRKSIVEATFLDGDEKADKDSGLECDVGLQSVLSILTPSPDPKLEAESCERSTKFEANWSNLQAVDEVPVGPEDEPLWSISQLRDGPDLARECYTEETLRLNRLFADQSDGGKLDNLSSDDVPWETDTSKKKPVWSTVISAEQPVIWPKSFSPSIIEDFTESDSATPTFTPIWEDVLDDNGIYIGAKLQEITLPRVELIIDDESSGESSDSDYVDMTIGRNLLTEISKETVDEVSDLGESDKSADRLEIFRSIAGTEDQGVTCTCNVQDSMQHDNIKPHVNGDNELVSQYKGCLMPEITQNSVPDDRPVFFLDEPNNNHCENGKVSENEQSNVYNCTDSSNLFSSSVSESSLYPSYFSSVTSSIWTSPSSSTTLTSSWLSSTWVKSPMLCGSPVWTSSLSSNPIVRNIWDMTVKTSFLGLEEPVGTGSRALFARKPSQAGIDAWSSDSNGSWPVYGQVSFNNLSIPLPSSFHGLDIWNVESIWKDPSIDDPFKIWDINSSRRLDAESPRDLQQISKYLFNLKLENAPKPKSDIEFIEGGLYGGALNSDDAWSTSRSECSEDESGLDLDDTWSCSSRPIELCGSASTDHLQWLDEDVLDGDWMLRAWTNKLTGSMDLLPSETSAFSKDSLPSRLQPCIHHVQSEPCLGPGRRLVEVKHLYKSDTSILKQLGLASDDEDEDEPRDGVEFSPERHFRPINTPFKPSPPQQKSFYIGDILSQKMSYLLQSDKKVEEEEDTATLTGSCGFTAETLEDVLSTSTHSGCSSYYQLYQGDETAADGPAFIPRFRIQHQDKNIQTGESPARYISSTQEEGSPKNLPNQEATVPSLNEVDSGLSERVFVDMMKVLDNEEDHTNTDGLTINKLDQSLDQASVHQIGESDTSKQWTGEVSSARDLSDENVDFSSFWRQPTTQYQSASSAFPGESSIWGFSKVDVAAGLIPEMETASGISGMTIWEKSSQDDSVQTGHQIRSVTSYSFIPDVVKEAPPTPGAMAPSSLPDILLHGNIHRTLAQDEPIQQSNGPKDNCRFFNFFKKNLSCTDMNEASPCKDDGSQVVKLKKWSEVEHKRNELLGILRKDFMQSNKVSERADPCDVVPENTKTIDKSNLEPLLSPSSLTGHGFCGYKTWSLSRAEVLPPGGEEVEPPGCDYSIISDGEPPEWMYDDPEDEVFFKDHDSSADLIFPLDAMDLTGGPSDHKRSWFSSDDSLEIQNPSRRHKPKPGGYSRKPCTFFLEGNCRRADCRFAHDTSQITCRFWEDGDCFKGLLCPFLHGYPSVGDVAGNPDSHREFNYEEDDFPVLHQRNRESTTSTPKQLSESSTPVNRGQHQQQQNKSTRGLLCSNRTPRHSATSRTAALPIYSGD